MGAGRANGDRANSINFVQLLDVWEARNFGLMMISTLEHLTEIHPSHPLGGLSSVVIIFNVNDQASKKIPNTISNLDLELIELTCFDECCNVVIGQERNALIN
mmetsp:Transcript_34944/g.81606  ORF Transcript_34944/g.81606 Transcript_34944/m.81606 type:complete len:103 (-) Transcript_34944:815-1123(-)